MLEVGNLFPDVSYRSYDGTIKDLYAQIGQGPAAILFLRYVGCTKCQLDIHQLLSHQKEIAEKGVQVFVVFQSAPSTVRESLTDFPFEILAHPTLGQGPGAGSRRRKTGPHLPRSAGRGILNKYRKFLWPNGNIL